MEGLINVALILMASKLKKNPVSSNYFSASNTQMRERWFSASTSWLSARLSAVWNKTFTRLRITSVLSHKQRQLLKTTFLTFTTYVAQLRSSEIVAYLKIVRDFHNLLMISTKQIAFICSHISIVHNPPPPGTWETLHQSLSQKILRCPWIKN